MKKTPLLITLGIILLAVAGYFLFERLSNANPTKPWDLVPANALIVYEKNSCNACIEEATQSNLASIIQSAVFYKKPVDSVKNKLSSLLKNKKGYLISVHVTKKDDFDFVYYLPNAQDVGSTFLSSISNYKLTSREFSSIQIHEIKSAKQIFSYANIDGVWIGSFTPFLIEDVIRTYKTNPGSAFPKNKFQSQGFSSIQDDAGNLYVRLEYFSELLTSFLTKSSNNYEIGTTSLLDLKSNENSLVLNGFSFDNNGKSDYLLSAFRHQSPVSFGLKHLITNRAVAVSSYGVSDGEAFRVDRNEFLKRKNLSISDTLAKLSKNYGFKLENLYKSISDEFAVCYVESSKGKKLSKILLIESTGREPWLKSFNSISHKLSIDTIFYEKYAQYEIREIPVFKFSEKLFWPFVTGFTQNFYTSVGNVILIGDNIEELKSFLDDIEADDTWGKSVSQNRFLESTLLESNVSLYFNPAKAWHILLGHLHPKWIGFVQDHQALLQSLQMASIQFSHLNNNYYTNVLFTYKPVAPNSKSVAGKTERLIVNFNEGLSNLYAVKSHVNRNNEVLIQDSLNDLSLVSSDGKPLWKISIGEQIISDVTQVDFFNNGKLQYFFSTQRAIHIVDRLGNYVDPFPIHLSGLEIEHISVIDYDNTKKYRILISDKAGKLWMYDKAGIALEGWKPRDVGGSLAMPPRHHRIKGKDYILAVRKDGNVFLMNRRGEDINKFPLNIESVPSGDYVLENGTTLSKTYFVIVSRDGFKVKFNMEGEVQSREALLKTSVTSNFSLVKEKTNKSYLIFQQDAKQLDLFDESGKRILSNTLVGLKPSDVKYFDYGADNVFIVLMDKLQGLSYIYDEQGNLLTTPPIETSAIEIRPQNNEQFQMFFIHDKSLVIQPLTP